ncbi:MULTISPECIES: pirin family protein [unclassified Minwuia]|jgi:redox-sensitive bicupin YhaK (pirin superfamily)|uniref:pirin family protein n=1 Tax=unclassified Minwuia TaxID=2618799 RepID=UPI002478DEF9|nr:MULTISPECIES: pirin family protein [unclassified Minwuia]
MTIQHKAHSPRCNRAITAIQQGEAMSRGTGFEALSFTHRQLDGLMDPLIMVDHFTMTEPTFGPHAHAGLSAVSVLFEDSTGTFRNRDSLGNDIGLGPGDLYWLKAARGAVHDEAPTPGSATHGLQIFVNLPDADRKQAPASLHVPAGQIPVLEDPGYRVRVITGESNGVTGAAPPALPLAILDITLQQGGRFAHTVAPDNAAWIHAIRGEVMVDLDGETHLISGQQALAVRNARVIGLSSVAGGQAVLLSGMPLREPFIQKGPFAMRNAEELAAVVAAHQAGELGAIG